MLLGLGCNIPCVLAFRESTTSKEGAVLSFATDQKAFPASWANLAGCLNTIKAENLDVVLLYQLSDKGRFPMGERDERDRCLWRESGQRKTSGVPRRPQTSRHLASQAVAPDRRLSGWESRASQRSFSAG